MIMERLRSADIAATTTASAAISMPWWLEQLPMLLAPWVALIGLGIAVLTLYVKYAEARIARRKLEMLELGAETE